MPTSFYSCCYNNCSTSSKLKDRRLYRFPKDEERCKLWVAAANNPRLNGKPSELLYKNARLCDKHFADWCFMNKDDKQRLVPKAIPDKNIQSPVKHQLTSSTSKGISNSANIDTNQRTMNHEDELLCLGAYILTLSATSLAIRKAKERRKKKFYEKSYGSLMKELTLDDHENYRRWLRMDVESFQYLLSKVSSSISKKDTKMRNAIPAEERLALTLKFLGTGESQKSLGARFGIGQSTISMIISAVCKALYEVLQPEYLVVPSSEEGWKEIAKRFYETSNFPMCIGALGGKRIKVGPPSKPDSTYRYSKDTSRIVLLAIVDTDYKFLYMEVVFDEHTSDKDVWNKSELKLALEKDEFKIPRPCNLPGTNVTVPYVLVTDKTFPLTTTLLKPYSQCQDNQKNIFNCRLYLAAGVAENAIGLLAARFQIFKTSLYMSPESCKSIVLTTCCLHNFLHSRSVLERNSITVDYEDIENNKIIPGEWRNYQNGMKPLEICKTNRNNYSSLAIEVREKFCNYFHTSGLPLLGENMED